MLALYRGDRQAEALAAYREARTALAELGIEPSERLRRLEKQILTHDAALELAPEERAGKPVPLPGALVAEPPFPFVGRADELSALHSLLDRAESGEGCLVLLSGEPGGGKTRLVRELAVEAAGRGALVCYGMSDAAVTVPYQPVLEWLEFLVRVCEPDVLARCMADGDELLPRLVPALRTLTGASAPEAEPDSPMERYQLQNAVVALLRRLSATRPLLLVAEDLHWADGETLSLLGRLARDGSRGAGHGRRHLPAAGRGDRPRAGGHPRRPLAPGRPDANCPRASSARTRWVRSSGGRRRRRRARSSWRRSASSPTARRCSSASSGVSSSPERPSRSRMDR